MVPQDMNYGCLVFGAVPLFMFSVFWWFARDRGVFSGAKYKVEAEKTRQTSEVH